MSKNLTFRNRKIKKLTTFGVVSVGSYKNHYGGLILLRIWGISIVGFWPKNHTRCQKIEKVITFSIPEKVANFLIFCLKTFSAFRYAASYGPRASQAR